MVLNELIIGIKGAGEMASGVAWRLHRSNIKNIFMMETKNPLAVRRRVSFCESVYDGHIQVQGVGAVSASNRKEIKSAWENNTIPVIIDPGWESIKVIQPQVVIDAIIAKKNLGTSQKDARLVIGLGPGFEAGKDVHMVVETHRGHHMGKVILKGKPEANTGIPGSIKGVTKERVLRAPCSGIFHTDSDIGTMVKKGDIIGYVDETKDKKISKNIVHAQIDGILRGMIRPNTRVRQQMKIGDIDPRGNIECTSISEKSRAVAGGVLEAILRTFNV